MKMTVRTVAHCEKKFWMRSEIDGPSAIGTRTAWCSCCESWVSASRMSFFGCTAPGVTSQVSADSRATSPLHPQDLSQGGPADLQLLRRGLARAQHALELMPRNPQGFCGPGGAVAL